MRTKADVRQRLFHPQGCDLGARPTLDRASYLVRQLKYPDTNKPLVLALLSGVRRFYDSTYASMLFTHHASVHDAVQPLVKAGRAQILKPALTRSTPAPPHRRDNCHGAL
jgi:hypothetical protein